MDGGICINEWLWREGYLAFKEEPKPGEIVSLEKLEIDWSRTKAWGSGGYYGRVFLNVQGREPQGTIPAAEYESFRDELAAKLRAIPGPNGEDIGTRVFKPQEIYRAVRGVPPDLMVYFGSLGHGGIYTFENDIGPDDCNHAQNGMFILYDPRAPRRGKRMEGAQLMDVAPTVLKLMGVPVPDGCGGRPWV